MTGHPPGRHLVGLDDVGRGDVALVGAKAANLGELRSAGYPVPDGFVVTVDARAAFEQEVRDAYRLLGGGEPPAVAVRSSGVDEDDVDGSHAGMYDTFLHVVGEDAVLGRIADCRASVGSGRVSAYRSAQGRHGESSMAVVVQLMAPTDRSGVMFSVDPTGVSPRSVLIEATDAGAGSVVDGSVTPDAYRVDEAGSVVSRPGSVGRPGVLRDEEAVALARLCRSIESHFGRPQDVEWTIGSDGSTWVVQARPITRISEPGEHRRGDSGAGTGSMRTADAPLAVGLGASSGTAIGAVRVLHSAEDGWDLEDGEVLVAPTTSPAWVPAMTRAAAIVTDVGGITSHAAIVARELGVPAVVGAAGATSQLRDGDVVVVDGDAGTVHRSAGPTG